MPRFWWGRGVLFDLEKLPGIGPKRQPHLKGDCWPQPEGTYKATLLALWCWDPELVGSRPCPLFPFWSFCVQDGPSPGPGAYLTNSKPPASLSDFPLTAEPTQCRSPEVQVKDQQANGLGLLNLSFFSRLSFLYYKIPNIGSPGGSAV